MHKGTLQIKAICSILTVRGSADIATLLCLFFVINTTQYHIEKQTSERILEKHRNVR